MLDARAARGMPDAGVRCRVVLTALAGWLAAPAAAFPCALCDAGYNDCGYCLNRLEDQNLCPAEEVLDNMFNCSLVDEGALCEADGECGTSTLLNNCGNMNWAGAAAPH